MFADKTVKQNWCLQVQTGQEKEIQLEATKVLRAEHIDF